MAAKSRNMNVVERATGIIRSPSAFFKSIKAEKGFRNAFIYLAIISIVSSVLNYFLNPASKAVFAAFGNLGFALILVMWVVGLALSFVVYGFFHLFVMLLGGRKGYHNTYKAFAYSSTPSALLGWVSGVFMSTGVMSGFALGMIVALVLAIWALYLTIKGVSVLQEMSMLRALAALIIGIAVIVVIALLAAGLFLLSLLSAL